MEERKKDRLAQGSNSDWSLKKTSNFQEAGTHDQRFDLPIGHINSLIYLVTRYLVWLELFYAYPFLNCYKILRYVAIVMNFMFTKFQMDSGLRRETNIHTIFHRNPFSSLEDFDVRDTDLSIIIEFAWFYKVSSYLSHNMIHRKNTRNGHLCIDVFEIYRLFSYCLHKTHIKFRGD